MKLLISNKAAMFGGLAAIPFVAAGSYFCMEGFSELFPPHMVVNLIVGYDVFFYRVLRGGSWFNNAGRCRAANRVGFAPGYYEHYGGFRVACSAAPGTL